MLDLPQARRQVVEAVGGLNVWKDLTGPEQEKAIRLFQQGLSAQAIENARDAVTGLRRETALLGDSLTQAAIQAAGGTEA